MLSWVKSLFATATSGYTAYLIGAAIAIGAVVGLVLHHDSATISRLTTQNAQYSVAVGQQKQVNAADQVAIAQLQAQTVAWNHAIDVVAQDYRHQVTATASLNSSIDGQTESLAQLKAACGQPGQTDGITAPVLENALRQIQKQSASMGNRDTSIQHNLGKPSKGSSGPH